MRILYVSDLDGTLLRRDETTSAFTNQVINELVNQGMLFSYATARSYVTATKATKGLHVPIPLIVYNGALIINNITGEILSSNCFDSSITDLLNDLLQNGIYPIVYSFIDGVEKFSYVTGKGSIGTRMFLQTRKGDRREHPTDDVRDLYRGDIFYITCIDDEDKLEPLYRKYQDQYHCVFQKDIYSGEQWLEFLPREASKAHAIGQLKEYLHCNRVVVFGDGKNDIDMFEIAEEAYAVENAVEDLKRRASGIIQSNQEDGVAKWLLENVKIET